MDPLLDQPLTILILADDPLALRGLTAVFADEPDLHVIPLEGLSNLTPATATQADLLLWDTGWDPDSARGVEQWEAVAELVSDGLPLVVLLPDDENPARYRSLGAVGLLRRSADKNQLLAALLTVSAGLHVSDPAFAESHLGGQSSSLLLPEPLTPREQEVLTLLAEGLTNRAIGRALAVSENTAKFHVQAVLGKLGVSSRTEAVVQATRLGLLTL